MRLKGGWRGKWGEAESQAEAQGGDVRDLEQPGAMHANRQSVRSQHPTQCLGLSQTHPSSRTDRGCRGRGAVSLAARLVTLGKGGGAELQRPISAPPFHTCRLLVAGPDRKYLDNARSRIQDVLRHLRSPGLPGARTETDWDK